MARGAAARKIEPGKETTKVQYATFPEMFVPGWDAEIGGGQKMARVEDRAAMGNKRTPLGPGTLRRPQG